MKELLKYWWIYKQQTMDDGYTFNEFMTWLSDNIDYLEEMDKKL